MELSKHEVLNVMKKGAKEWNSLKSKNVIKNISLRSIDFEREFQRKHLYDLPTFKSFDFSDIDFYDSIFRNCVFIRCKFDSSKMNYMDLCYAYFSDCSFINTQMRVTRIGSANFENCIFENSDLSYCSAEGTSFRGSKIAKTYLDNINFISADFSETNISDCSVYGISAWDLILSNSTQHNLIITKDDTNIISIDNLELAQFLYLVLNNKKLRNIIEIVTSKIVLILGNFSKENKVILDRIKNIIRLENFIPVLFDFEKPSSKNLSETVVFLASIAKFIISDITTPRSVAHELAVIAPLSQSANIYPIINENEKVYDLFESHNDRPTMKKIRKYNVNNIELVIKEIITKEKPQEQLF